VSVGPLRDGGHRRLLDAIERLATTARPVEGADGERLIIELTARGAEHVAERAMQPQQHAPEFGVSLVPGGSGVHVVAIRGDVDIFTAPEVKRAAREAVFGSGNLIVLDLTDTTFIDSTGLGVIIGLAKLVRPAGDLAIVNVDPAIAKTLKITGLDDIFAVRATRAEAIDALTRR
jgi:anti-sigma B factor antagonist